MDHSSKTKFSFNTGFKIRIARSFKIVAKTLKCRIFQKILENPHFHYFMPKYASSLKLDCISFCRLKATSKKVEKSNV